MAFPIATRGLTRLKERLSFEPDGHAAFRSDSNSNVLIHPDLQDMFDKVAYVGLATALARSAGNIEHVSLLNSALSRSTVKARFPGFFKDFFNKKCNG